MSNHDADAIGAAFEAAYGVDYTALAAVAIPYLPNGCSWGLVTKRQARDLGIKDMDREKLAAERQVYFYQLEDGGYLVHHDFNTLAAAATEFVPVITDKVIDLARKSVAKSYRELEKCLDKAYKAQYSNPQGQGLRMGFYCLNDNPTITINSVSYPAFSVSLHDLAGAAAARGFKFRIGRDSVPAQDVQASLVSNPDGVLTQFRLAPSTNAILTTLTQW